MNEFEAKKPAVAAVGCSDWLCDPFLIDLIASMGTTNQSVRPYAKSYGCQCHLKRSDTYPPTLEGPRHNIWLSWLLSPRWLLIFLLQRGLRYVLTQNLSVPATGRFAKTPTAVETESQTKEPQLRRDHSYAQHNQKLSDGGPTTPATPGDSNPAVRSSDGLD